MASAAVAGNADGPPYGSPVISSSKDAESREAKVALKAERARDAADAMREYEAKKVAVDARTAELRKLRMREAAKLPPKSKTKQRKRS